MGCRAREYEMSLSLDGRLPSGQRSALLRHIAQCPTCSATWESMKAAQDAALDLPSYDVGAEFRDMLHHRIASGEGAPEAVYHDPVPARAKVRYLLSGAAAAALLIMGINLVLPQGESTDPGTPAQSDVAARQPAATETLRPSDRTRLGSPVAGSARQFASTLPRLQAQPVNEQSIAQPFAETLANSSRELRGQFRSLARRPIEDAWREMEPVVNRIDISVRTLRQLESMDVVTLPDALKRDFNEADVFVRLAKRAEGESRRKALQQLQQLQLHTVPNRLLISCCRPRAEMICNLQVLVERVPGIVHIIPSFHLDNRNALQPVEVDRAPGGMVIWIEQGK